MRICLRDRPEVERDWYFDWLRDRGYLDYVDVCAVHGLDPKEIYTYLKDKDDNLSKR